MSKSSWLRLQLLKGRRKDFDVPVPLREPKEKNFRFGVLVGSGFVGTAVIACFVALGVDHFLKGRERSMAADVALHQDLTARSLSAVQLIQQLSSSNQGVADGIAAIQSGSALLSEISRLVSSDLSLREIKVRGDLLEVSGLTPMDRGLFVLNAFVLRLSRSSFFLNDGVLLTDVKDNPEGLSFQLQATFSPDLADKVRTQLRDLKSDGLAERISILRDEGFVK